MGGTESKGFKNAAFTSEDANLFGAASGNKDASKVVKAREEMINGVGTGKYFIPGAPKQSGGPTAPGSLVNRPDIAATGSEDVTALVQSFQAWQAQQDKTKQDVGAYRSLAAQSPGRASTILSSNSPGTIIGGF